TILQIGMSFANMEDVRTALENYSIQTSLPYKFQINKPNKLLVICPTNETSKCSFIISANKRKDGYIYIVKLINHNQDCPTHSETFKARGSYLKKFTAPLIEDISALKPRDIMNRLHSEVANRKRGIEEIEKSYQHIKSLLDNLSNENPGSPWIEATEHCRPVFTFDACHSKSSYKGVYLSVSIIEGENKLVPIAFAICAIENSDN
ncbi:6600_t:CDS:2, partial [Acaulospora morrowiae]